MHRPEPDAEARVETKPAATASGAGAPPASTGAPLTHPEIRRIIFGVVMAMFLAALDQTIIATALPTIGRELGDFDLLSWVVTAYLLTATAATPLYGKISDIRGRRPTMLVGISIFVIGSVACALAPSMLFLIIARGVQGLGGGGLISLAQTIIGDIVAPKERGRYQAYIAGVFVSSSLAGPVLGGFFAEHLHWSIIFWINVPLGLVAYLMTDRLLRRLPRHDRPHALDILGAVLIIAATSLLMLALNWAGTRFPWLSQPILVLGAGSLVLWVAFAARLATAPEPLIPLTLFANPVVRNGTLAALFGMGTFIGLSIYVPVYLEAVVGLSASDSGMALIPLMVGTVCGATLAGRLMTRVVHYKRISLVGLAASVVATALLSWKAASLPLPLLEVLFALFSIGLGTLFPMTTVSIQNAVPLHQLGTATAGMNFFRSLGGALVVAGFGALLLGGGIEAGLHGPAHDAHAAASQGVVDAFRAVFGAATACLAVSMAFLLAMEELPLRSGAPAPSASAEH
jgi:EmrB/QacA subfamily drug resistance transporter